MRVMLDTNILVSLAFFPSDASTRFKRAVSENHEIVLCDYIIEEFVFVANRKFPARLREASAFLDGLRFDFVYAPKAGDMPRAPQIRDSGDMPILAAAISENVDILVTGDKDFLVLDIPAPKIMTMAEFIERYG